MAAPTNISFATAIDVGTLSRDSLTTFTQTVDDAGTTYTVWYTYTAVPTDTELMAFPWGGGGSYTPDVTFWTDASTQVLFNNAQNRPSQLPITPGTTYGIKLSPNGGNPSPANLRLQLKLGPIQALSANLLAINDSTAGYPAVIMNPATGEPVAFKSPFAAGEGTAVLQSGLVAAIDVDGDGVVVYDQHLDVLTTPTMPATGYTECLACNQVDTWIVGKTTGGNGKIVSFNRLGTFGIPLDTTAVGCKTIACNRAVSIIYFARSVSVANTALLAMTNPGGVVSTFKAGVAGKFFGANILTLTDDTILVPYEEAGVDTIVRHYNAAGAEQVGSPITLTGVQNALERLFNDPDDPTHFWAWWQTSTQNRFQKITTATGVVTTNLTWPKFIEGDYQGAAAATPDAYFGADFSCVPWVLRGVAETDTTTIRRQRRFLLPSSDDNKRISVPTLELLLRTGIGLTPAAYDGANVPQGANPQVMLRISKDGGVTWGPERWRSAGTIGKYLTRARWLQATGNYRNAVCEVTVSDPVSWQMLAAIGEPVEGSS